jgi:hypothetical protein
LNGLLSLSKGPKGSTYTKGPAFSKPRYLTFKYSQAPNGFESWPKVRQKRSGRVKVKVLSKDK